MVQKTDTDPQDPEESDDMTSTQQSKNRMLMNTILGVILVVLIGTAIYYLVSPDKNAPLIEDTTTQSTSSITPSITETTASPTASAITGTTYETDSIKLTIPDGWTAAEGTKEESTDPTASKKVPDAAIVTVVQGNYSLTIDADKTPSGGPEGGRLSDIMNSALSVTAVIPVQPTSCGSYENHDGFLPDHPRVDLYMASTDKAPGCNAPTAGTVWYFSYMGPGAISGYQNATNGVAITMSYSATDVNKLPSKDDPTLADMLTQMTSIAKTLVLKTATLAPVSTQ